MSLPVLLSEAARLEFDDAFDWYESKQAGLGVEFAAAVQDVFDRISQLPFLHSVVKEDVRRAVVRRFPYSVFYRPEDDRIVVVAVFHDRRDPIEWQRRI